jgi:hypothetical protein
VVRGADLLQILGKKVFCKILQAGFTYWHKEEVVMSLMCKMNGACSQTKGKCGHEKMMALVMVMGLLGGVGYYWLH